MSDLLPAQLLSQIRRDAPGADRDRIPVAGNIRKLVDCGYTKAWVPADLGGGGASFEQILAAQIELAKHCPATALAANMHQIWMGVAAHLQRAGRLEAARRIWADAVAGEVYGFGISEAGNDYVLLKSTVPAVRADDGSYTVSGTKIFNTNASGWTRLGTFAAVDTPDGPRSVYGVICREDGGIDIDTDWDALGMRASDSQTLHLRGARIRPDRVVDVVEPFTPAAPVITGIFVYFEVLLAAVYTGIAARALEVGTDTVRTRRSVKLDGVYADDPHTRWRIAAAAMAVDGIYPQLTLAARDLDAGVERPAWLPQSTAIKIRATEVAKYVVEEIMRACGGNSMRNSGELPRLYRDVLAGLFQPSDAESAHAAWALALLGPIGASAINPGAKPSS